MISCILCFIPEPSATMEATEVMPMMMPNIVRKVRRRCARSALAAILKASVKRAKRADARRAVCGGAFSWGLEHFSVIFAVSLRARRIVHTVFALDCAVLEFNDTLRVRRDLRGVCDQNHSMAVCIQLMQDIHHLLPAFAVERASGFVRQNNLAAVHQCARDTDALLLAARKLRGPVVRALR